ncbi:MAG: 50S ribosomal protein L24 [Candidatus Pacebacteria bacterium]|nr:50S ribosomal protein L24 [Candidatus Paceibacterota bacterium]
MKKNILNVKKGDKVKILAGKEKGKEGVVQKSFPQDNKVTIEGLNLVKKHKKSQNKQPGTIISIPKPIHASNVKKINN